MDFDDVTRIAIELTAVLLTIWLAIERFVIVIGRLFS
jgi:hypothetical protein